MYRSLLAGVCAGLLALSPAVAQQGKPSVTRTEDFRDWKLVCGKPASVPNAPERCNLTQDVVLKEQNVRVLLVEVAKTPQGEVMIIVVPTGILLPPGLRVAVDGGKEITVPFEICTAQGCQTALRLDPAFMATLKKGTKATVTFTDASRQNVGVPLSLAGFTAGVSRLN